MRIDDLFYGYEFDRQRLADFGFIQNSNGFFYTRNIEDAHLRITVLVRGNSVELTVWDTDFDEESLAASTVPSIKRYWIELVDEIKTACCRKRLFASNCANELNDYIAAKYGVQPEFLWEKYPDCAVYRNKKSNKWFSILMRVNRGVLESGKSGMVEIMNFKVDNVEKMLETYGFFPAYHMNKKYWITVLLDGSVPPQNIFEVVDKSVLLTSK